MSSLSITIQLCILSKSKTCYGSNMTENFSNQLWQSWAPSPHFLLEATSRTCDGSNEHRPLQSSLAKMKHVSLKSAVAVTNKHLSNVLWQWWASLKCAMVGRDEGRGGIRYVFQLVQWYTMCLCSMPLDVQCTRSMDLALRTDIQMVKDP